MPKKLDGLRIAKEIAEERGGKCLSIKYINSKTKMLWKCKQGHVWEAILNSIKDHRRWCPHCAKTKKLDGLRIAKEIAEERGGKCLSIKYINIITSMLWECKYGHRWEVSLNNIKNGNNWCSICAGVKINGLKEARSIALSNSGYCLSTKYVNNRTKMKWQCRDGHVWNTTFDNVRSGCWCPECAQTKRARSQNNSYILYHWKTEEEVVCVASYEKKVVEYFNTNKVDFRWQPRSFLMPDGRKYYPDCYLFSTKKWIEIKGYFRKDAKEKWDWFHNKHPNSELWNKNKLKEMEIL